MRITFLLSFLLLAACRSPYEGGALESLSEDSRRTQFAIAKRIRSDLEHVESIQILSVGYAPGKDGEEYAGFIGYYPILAEASISDKSEVDTISISLAEGIKKATGIYMLCFTPRHAIRYTIGDRMTEILICFECLKGRLVESGNHTEFFVTHDPEGAWDELFKKYNLPKVP